MFVIRALFIIENAFFSQQSYAHFFSRSFYLLKILWLENVVVFSFHGENHFLGSYFRRVIVPQVFVVLREIRVARDPEFDGVGLAVEVDHAEAGQHREEEGDGDHQHRVPGHHRSMPC